jgi:acylaminoacyl-peptidase
VLQCNYRGSIGFGQQDLTSLLGKAGRQDVDDVIACLDAAIAQKLVDPTRVAVVGGSHGGFLAAHLIGQHPQRFYCAVMRNPVTDISSMVGLTDIPDWCFVESAWLGKSSYDESPSSEKLARMRAVSPIAVVNNVRAPVLMLLGAKDRRVPASNGLAYARALKHRGVTVRTILFPEDEHPLSKPRTEMESFLNALEWLNTHQPK